MGDEPWGSEPWDREPWDRETVQGTLVNRIGQPAARPLRVRAGSTGRRLGGAGAALGLCTLIGCSGAVDLEPADLGPQDAAICANLLPDLPPELAGQGRRDVAPVASGVAWGDPPVTLRCGVTDAEGLGPASECQVVDGVGWYPEELSDGYRFTTIGRTVPVEVVVPAAYAPEVGPLTAIADAVVRHDPELQGCV